MVSAPCGVRVWRGMDITDTNIGHAALERDTWEGGRKVSSFKSYTNKNKKAKCGSLEGRSCCC